MTTIEVATEETYNAAVALATKAHEGQMRWEGDPYVTHPIRVAKGVEGWEAKCVAVLHDVVEDTPITLADIGSEFGQVIRDGVDAVTYRNGESYCDFILRSKQDPLGRVVKIADITDNLRDIDSYKNQKERKEKYILARWILCHHQG